MGNSSSRGANDRRWSQPMGRGEGANARYATRLTRRGVNVAAMTAAAIGIDFGTTNSAVASASSTGVTLARFGPPEARAGTFRSVLCFDPDDRAKGGRPRPVAGPRAIERYLQLGGEGRFLQSLKSYLPSRLFQSTAIYGHRFSLEELIGALVADLKAAAGESVGAFPGVVVVGRPVRFVGAEKPEDDAYAEDRLRRALGLAGLPEVVFEYEPVGAAFHYEAQLDRDELVLIADFGGGTSDFCLARVGPKVRARGRTREDLLGTAGVGIAGDVFDGQIVRHVVAPHLGKGSTRRAMEKEVALPAWIFGYLERWHYLSFLKTPDTLDFVREAARTSNAPARLAALLHVVESDLGLALYRAVERTKIELSEKEATTFVFDDAPVSIEARVTRRDFESWIAPEVQAIATCVDGLLAQTRTAPGDVDRVFLTGGTALVPAVRRVFAERFGAGHLRGGDELTSVASGLALRARELAAR